MFFRKDNVENNYSLYFICVITMWSLTPILHRNVEPISQPRAHKNMILFGFKLGCEYDLQFEVVCVCSFGHLVGSFMKLQNLG